MEIGKRIKDIRTRKRMTAKELSKLSGMPEKSIYKIESGEVKDPRISSIRGIANGLNCSIDELVNGVNVRDTFRKLYGIINSTDKLDPQESEFLNYRLEKLRVDLEFDRIYHGLVTKEGLPEELALQKTKELMEEDIFQMKYLQHEYESRF